MDNGLLCPFHFIGQMTVCYRLVYDCEFFAEKYNYLGFVSSVWDAILYIIKNYSVPVLRYAECKKSVVETM